MLLLKDTLIERQAFPSEQFEKTVSASVYRIHSYAQCRGSTILWV